MGTIKTGAVRNRRKAQETKMWSDDIRQIVAIFQEQFQAGGVIMDPAKYVAKYQSELKAAGPELTFLQLAGPDKKSPFGVIKPAESWSTARLDNNRWGEWSEPRWTRCRQPVLATSPQRDHTSCRSFRRLDLYLSQN